MTDYGYDARNDHTQQNQQNTATPFGGQTPAPGFQGGYAPNSFQPRQAPGSGPRGGYTPDWVYSSGGYIPQKPKKKKRKAMRVIAAGLAVAVIGFGSGYLGSILAGGQSAGQTGITERQVSPPVLTTTAAANTDGSESLVEQVAAATANSVVEITTESVQTDRYFRQSIVSGAGSGVIISADGYIATNNHVVEGSESITVTLRDGTQYPAVLIGTDAKTDVAVIKVEATGLQPAVLGDSDTLRIGEPAIVIGNPLGQLGGTVTNGIISALDRQITIEGETMTLLQTNAAINPGNSGGALFNERGELVGIVNAKSGGTENGTTIEGIGFAIPVNVAKSVITDLITYGYVQGRIDLGFATLDVQDAITAMLYRLDSTGVYIAQVEEGSNAQRAGLQAGDRILSIDGVVISASSQINTALDSHKVGDQVTIVIARSGRQAQAVLTLEEYKGEGLSI